MGLYDRRGQLQRVALARGDAEYQEYIDNGFIEITESEYNRGREIAPPVRTRDLALLATAATALSSIESQRSRPILSPTFQPPRNELRILQRELDRELKSITSDYLSGRISIAAWERKMIDTVNQGNLASRILSTNGSMTGRDLRAVERANEIQAQYLAGFRQALESGSLSERMALNRAGLYSEAGKPVFETGYTEAIGLPELPVTPGVGSYCRNKCLCHWDITQLEGNGNYDCYWTLGRAEHCETCIARAFTFNPLRVRLGVIQPYIPAGRIFV